ncbi:MAG: MrcB family domain-containing protein [Halodesulfovibrio sp.]|uniref:MrcB family domain-containing protein n=1 Tax=Halodesulfovibrio sp. TaxID=1912772 RepID=UPI00359D0F41
MQVPTVEEGLRGILTEIMEAIFLGARKERLKNHPLSLLVRYDFKEILNSIATRVNPALFVETSVGLGHWATILWGAILDPNVTDRTSKEYVVVYHFDPSGEKVFLSICQGAGCVVDEYGHKDGLAVLRKRATFARKRIADQIPKNAISSMSFTSSKSLPTRYESGFITGFKYQLENMPSEQELQHDLEILCRLYQTLTGRGGLLPNHSAEPDLPSSNVEDELCLSEQRKYYLHKKIERNQALVTCVKERKGHKCECCGMTFKDVYGKLGENYIEAHHLKPLSELAEDKVVLYDPIKDFAVLCANCHRMIHRMDDPSDITGLRAIVGS